MSACKVVGVGPSSMGSDSIDAMPHPIELDQSSLTPLKFS